MKTRAFSTKTSKTLTSKMWIAPFAVAAIALIPLAASAFLGGDSKVKLRAVEAGTIEDIATKTTRPLNPDGDLEYELTAPAFVSLNGRIPLMLIPIPAGTSQVALNPPTIRDVTAAPKQKEMSKSISEIMVGIAEIQKDIQKRDVEQAANKLTELRQRYPSVDFLEFVSASILLLKGEKAAARRAVTQGLEAHPDYKDGREFLKALGGADGKEKKDAK